MTILRYDGKIGFDCNYYTNLQSSEIIKRASRFKKLYLEFGGKLMYDYHAARVLPGYEINAKMKTVKKLAKLKNIEFLLCVNADYIEKEEKLGSLNMTYNDFTLKMISEIRNLGFKINTCVINFFNKQKKAIAFSQLMKEKGMNVYFMNYIDGYPKNIKAITSEKGFAKKPFIKTNADIVIVTGAGPNSGKMATCLAMIYQDYLKGIDSGYAKFETFPVWNISINSPINIAYEAATADIGDYNVIDPYHLKAYGIKAVNYNRDVETFGLLKILIKRLISKDNFMHNYKSPTDMGINTIKDAITDIRLCEKAAKQEIIRRAFRYYVDFLKGSSSYEAYKRAKEIINKHKLSIKKERPIVYEARKIAKGSHVGCALYINGKIISAKDGKNMHAEASVLIKALKYIANIKEEEHVLWQNAIERVKELRSIVYKDKDPHLTIKEMLILLSISSEKNKKAKKMMAMLNNLNGAEMHTTHMLSNEEESILLKLGINATSDGRAMIKRVVF